MVGPKYDKTNQDGIYNTVSINRLTRVSKEEIPETEPMTDTRGDNKNDTSEASTRNNITNFYNVEKIFKHNY